MNDYLIRATYTPTDPDSDRRRLSTVVSTDQGVVKAIDLGLSSLEIGGISTDAIADYLQDIGDEDTSEGWAWETATNNGEWHLEWSPFDSDDPITKETFLAWARREAGPMIGEDGTDEELRQMLVCVLGRYYWMNIDQWSSHDLKEQLHSQMVADEPFKPYGAMTIDELVHQIFEEGLIEYCRESHDEIKTRQPFGLKLMVSNNEALWLDR